MADTSVDTREKRGPVKDPSEVSSARQLVFKLEMQRASLVKDLSTLIQDSAKTTADLGGRTSQNGG